MPLIFDHLSLGQRVVFHSGHGLEHVIEQIDYFGGSAVMLIAAGSAAEVADRLEARLPLVARVDRVVQHVPVSLVDSASSIATRAGADMIVAIGGGSAIGLAKAIALRTDIPIIAAPTTFAGSEATNIWGVTENGRKMTGSHASALPVAVVYDAELTMGLPSQLAITSGLNAIAHAVDGFWAPREDPINRAIGAEGLRALVPGLRNLRKDPQDLDAREQTLYGAYLAAVAFASAGSGLHHRICHVLGGAFDLPHAPMHSIVLSYVTAFNAPVVPDAATRIAAAFGSVEAESAAALVDRFRRELGAPAGLKDIGLSRSALPEAARLILPVVPESNPRTVTPRDMDRLLGDAWAGTPIR